MRRQRGFTLLELIAAVALFTLVVTLVLDSTTTSAEKAISAAQARTLRYLAEYKLSELLVFERQTTDFYDGSGDFKDLGEEFEDYEWEYTGRDVVVFGTKTDDQADYYFEEDASAAEEDEENEAAGQQPQQNEGSEEKLYELTLTVKAPAEEGEGDSLKVVTLLPIPATQAAPSPTPR